MASIKNESQYEKSVERIEELLKVVGNNTPADDKNFIELDLLSELVAEYEENYLMIEKPSLSGIKKLKMAEMGISQKGPFKTVKNFGDNFEHR